MIFLIRHGESFDNKNLIFSGYQNCHLTDLEADFGYCGNIKKRGERFYYFFK